MLRPDTLALTALLALAVSGRPFYPGETEYCFALDEYQTAHVLVAVAR